MYKIVAFIFKAISVFIGSISLFIAALAIMDPKGAQLANDNDPFGEPPGLIRIIIIMAISILFITWPFLLHYYKKR